MSEQPELAAEAVPSNDIRDALLIREAELIKRVRMQAAAPDLLDALISLVAWTKFELSPEMQQIKPWSSVLAKCDAAIAKAEGRIPDIQIKGAA